MGQRAGREQIKQLGRQLEGAVPAYDDVLLPGAAFRTYPSVADRDCAPKCAGHRRVMGYCDNGGSLASVRRPDQLDYRRRRLRVKLRGRLVGEQQPGFVGEGEGQREPLLLAAGKPPGTLVGGSPPESRPARWWATGA